MTFDLRHRLPTADELAKFDRRHVVAFAARCARRVQPIYHAMWPGAVLASGFIVEQAIRASLKPGSAAGDSARTASDADDYDYDDYARDYAEAYDALASAGAARASTNAARTADAADVVKAAYAAADAAEAAYDAADAAYHTARAARTARADSRLGLIRLITDDFQMLRHQLTVNQPNRLSAVHFGPLWGVTFSTHTVDTWVTTWDRSPASRVLKRTPARAVVGFAARCVGRVHALADLDPAADTTGVVYATWHAESVAWDVRATAPGPGTRRMGVVHLPRGERNRVSPQRQAVTDTVDRVALATLQAANSIEAESDCIESTLLAADEAIEAARLADEVDCEEFGHPSTAHTDSLLAGMWDDLSQLIPSADGPAPGLGPLEHYRPLWEFNYVTDLPARIANLKKRFAPPPAPLILPRFPKLTEDQQRWIESYAGQLVGGPESVKAWFAMKIPDLGNKTPTQILTKGNVALLEMHIQSALHGDFG